MTLAERLNEIAAFLRRDVDDDDARAVESAAVIVEAAERMDSVVRARIKELEAKHGTLASCGGYEGMEYSYDMEAAAALNELHQIAALAAAGRPHAEK